MDENERIVCEFLRKIAPSREWRYLGEVEHYWIGELCDELNKQLKDENAKLRERVAELDELLPENGRWFSFETVDAYVVENRKLRELVQDFDKCLTEAVRLAYIQGHATIYDGTLLDSLYPRMHELGIEVPE